MKQVFIFEGGDSQCVAARANEQLAKFDPDMEQEITMSTCEFAGGVRTTIMIALSGRESQFFTNPVE